MASNDEMASLSKKPRTDADPTIWYHVGVSTAVINIWISNISKLGSTVEFRPWDESSAPSSVDQFKHILVIGPNLSFDNRRKTIDTCQIPVVCDNYIVRCLKERKILPHEGFLLFHLSDVGKSGSAEVTNSSISRALTVESSSDRASDGSGDELNSGKVTSCNEVKYGGEVFSWEVRTDKGWEPFGENSKLLEASCQYGTESIDIEVKRFIILICQLFSH